jgi:phosphate transport system substrate-binding protein
MRIGTLTKSKWAALSIGALALLAVGTAACGDDDSTSPAGGSPVASPAPGGLVATIGKDDSGNLTGAGATFPQVIYTAWFDDYNKKVAKNVQVNYQGVGSGAGVTQFTANTVDFGASDVGMNSDQLSKAPDAQLLPTVIGAVVMSYNLSGVASLKLDGPTIANIYLGNIKKWNDPAITALNPGVSLPGNDIQVAYRSDSSGTSGVFTDYLSKVSDDWKTKVGAATAPKWPVGQGGQGNPGVATVVKQTPNSIGYIELTYALQNKLGFADVKNAAGKFITPSIDSASAAASGVTLPEPQYQTSITNAPGDTAYPISTFTYLLLFKNSGKCTQQTPLVDMLWWVFHDSGAQQTIKDNSYAPLPTALLPRIEATLKSLKCDGGSKSSLKAS